MNAKPIIPGRVYHVSGCGITATVIAAHGCDAILIGLQIAGVLSCND